MKILIRKKQPPKPRYCQKLEKKQIFNYFLITIWIRKSNHENQDIAKSWKNQSFNYLYIRILN